MVPAIDEGTVEQLVNQIAALVHHWMGLLARRLSEGIWRFEPGLAEAQPLPRPSS